MMRPGVNGAVVHTPAMTVRPLTRLRTWARKGELRCGRQLSPVVALSPLVRRPCELSA